MKSFKYSNRPKSYITVKVIDDPYGSDENPAPVISVGCTLKADFANPTWKVHIPMDLAHSVGKELIGLSQQYMSDISNRRKKEKPGSPPSPPKQKKEDSEIEKHPDQSTERALAEGRVVRRKKGEKK